MVTGVFAWSSFSDACKASGRLDNCGHKRRMIFQTHLCNHRETVLGRYAARPPPNFDIPCIVFPMCKTSSALGSCGLVARVAACKCEAALGASKQAWDTPSGWQFRMQVLVSYARLHLLERLALRCVMACRAVGESHCEHVFCQAAAAKLALVALERTLVQR